MIHVRLTIYIYIIQCDSFQLDADRKEGKKKCRFVHYHTPHTHTHYTLLKAHFQQFYLRVKLPKVTQFSHRLMVSLQTISEL